MALPARRISYVGCVMAGKMYSVHSLLARNRQPLPDPLSELRERPHKFVLTREDRPLVEVSIQIADRRATAIDYDLTAAACDTRIRAEMAEIAKGGWVTVWPWTSGGSRVVARACARVHQAPHAFILETPRRRGRSWSNDRQHGPAARREAEDAFVVALDAPT